MPRRKRVDPVRVHLLTLAVFGVLAACALAVWTFPKFFGFLLLLGVSAVAYARLYGFIEQRLEAEEGRLAAELGIDLDGGGDDVLAPRPRRRSKAPKRKAARTEPAPGTASPDATEPDLATPTT